MKPSDDVQKPPGIILIGLSFIMGEEEKDKYLSDGVATWSDLEAAYNQDTELAKRLKRMSKHYRKPPKDDRQLDIFSPVLSDISTKDDISLMDVAVFGLGRKPRFEPIEYDLKDAHIVVQGGTKCGMATIFDYDIFLYMVSYLTHEMNRVREEVRQGHEAYLPPRIIKPPVCDLLKYCRRDDGGENYKLLEAALERLSTTKISIKKKDSKRRRAGMFSLIGDYKIITETRTGNISELLIAIPDWVYDGIVRPDNPTVLTLHGDYFLLSQGYHRFLHRLARKAAGKGEALYSIEKLYERSGSNRTFRSWKSDIKKAIAALKENPLPEYNVTWEEKSKAVNIRFVFTGEKTKTGDSVQNS
jgi:plasmid replication initiation protein